MALYEGPPGVVNAVQLIENYINGAEVIGQLGDWIAIYSDGLKYIIQKLEFETKYKQVFPRAINYEI